MLAVRLYWILLGAAALVLLTRVATEGRDALQLGQESEYHFEEWIEVSGAAGEFEVEVYVPAAGPRLRIQDENISAGELQLRVESGPSGRRLVARGRREDLPEEIRYRGTLRIQPTVFELSPDLDWELAETGVDSTDLVPAGHPEIVATLGRLFELPDSTHSPEDAAAWQTLLGARGVGPVEFTRRIHAWCLEDIRPASFSGSTDALTALRLGESSCGGKSRLMAALARTVGLPTRLLGGVLLGDAESKRTSHVWVEVLLGDHWVPYDPLNAYAERLPDHYLPLYVGDLPLIRHSRGLAFDYGFRGPREEVPRAWTLRTDVQTGTDLPLLRRNQFSLILLAPFALLFAVFCRQVVGLDSIGVFLPVLLGFCVTQIGWALAAALLALTLLFGVLVRLLLLRMHLLHVPRAGILITFLVLLFLVFTVSLEEFGIDTHRGILILPMAALAMAVERFTVEALDRGTAPALQLLVETTILAAGSALILIQPLFKILTVSYPEILLVVVAEMIMIGQYRGLRLRELWRFRALREVPR